MPLRCCPGCCCENRSRPSPYDAQFAAFSRKSHDPGGHRPTGQLCDFGTLGSLSREAPRPAGIEVLWRQFLAVAVIGVVFLGLALLRFRKTAVTGVA